MPHQPQPTQPLFLMTLPPAHQSLSTISPFLPPSHLPFSFALPLPPPPHLHHNTIGALDAKEPFALQV
jgi:hypothetical protein